MFNSKVELSGLDQLSLSQLMGVLYQKYKDEMITKKRIKEICLQTNSPELQKTGMEFLYMNGFYTELETLILKNHQSSYTSNRKWALVYQYTLERRKKQTPPRELLGRLNFIRTKEPELTCLVELLRVTLHYDLQEYSKLGNFLYNQPQLFNEVEDNVLRNYFHVRLYQILLTYYTLRDQVIMARKFGYRLLNQSTNAMTKIGTHIKLGLTYTFDSYTQGMYHFHQALELAKHHHIEKYDYLILQRNIPFLAAHWNRVDNIYTKDKSEQAHIEIAKGNNQNAIEILEELPLNSPFQLYYMGRAKQDKQLLLKSYREFIEKRSDHFFSKLPLAALKKMNSKEEI
ncbi:AimR family lysis-lysogeny pheromone receptor [Virgibacillus halodenitrificans]|nr:AimR family lysis-lysogeny pheromone receptor [Virgibacillus halodenitrificans]MBD1221457.1 hypothetical protein [Virgibacillus halodenitrificans]MCG1028193.1 AimR family lysis-lysogeny pheromone receptor [Virgibacillus halodenitrificans]MCJ0929574.1 AimR family lysis-lysogeny pheromone receptor [Virgibacillus halodenitrificans]MEC2158939.1 AimR family lysis-lysogeny pheromone receptor [Virgibacillus halodenitrificans]